MSEQKIKNYLLQKQSLLNSEEKSGYLDIVQNHLGLHSTDYLTPYLSLWSRIKDFNPENLMKDLSEGIAVRKRAYRGTVFVIHKSILKLIIRSSEYFTSNWIKGFIRYSVKENIDYNFYKQKIVSQFKGGNQFTVHELKKIVDIDQKSDFLNLFLRYLELDGTLVRTPQRYLQDKVINYGLLADFYPEIADEEISPIEAISTILKLYIQQYGPVTLDDFCWWLPLTKTKTKEALEKIKDKIIEITFNNETYLMTKEDHQKFEKFDDSKLNEPIVNFLPYEDHFPKAYTNRSWFLSNENQKYLFETSRIELGQLQPSIWLNCEIIGRWEINYLDSKKTTAEVIIKYLDESKVTSKEITNKINQRKKELEEYLNTKLLPLANER